MRSYVLNDVNGLELNKCTKEVVQYKYSAIVKPTSGFQQRWSQRLPTESLKMSKH